MDYNIRYQGKGGVMSILEKFPHINKRIVKGDDSEVLMYSIKYAKEFVSLNIKMPKKSNYIRLENGGVLFRLLDDADTWWNGISKNFLTSITQPVIKKIDYQRALSIGIDAFGEFKKSYNDDEFYLTNDSYNSPSYQNFNKFWKLTPYDDGYRTPLNDTLSHVRGRQIPIDQKRYSYLNKTYGNGNELIILDIPVPEKSTHTRVEEGVIFWVTNFSGDHKEHYVLSTVPKGDTQPVPRNSFVIYDSHYGNAFHDSSYYTPQERVSWDDRLKVTAFKRFWKNI